MNTHLFMGAFNRRNKQADLQKKMALAKKQKQQKESEGSSSASSDGGSNDKMTAAEIKEMNDRKRFDDLLNSESVTHMSELGGGTYLTTQQEEEEIDAAFIGIDRIFEGDPAPTQPFEDLIHYKTNNAVGKVGTERLLPWLKKNSSTEYVICITDPREKSMELRRAMKTIPNKFRGKQILFINADSPAENRRFTKKNEIEDIIIYSDEKREWMRAYTALGKKRWSLTMFILADGKVQKLIRELDVDLMDKAISNAINSLTI